MVFSVITPAVGLPVCIAIKSVAFYSVDGSLYCTVLLPVT
jgi:hypothetical protein